MAITTDAEYDRWNSLASSTFDGIDEDEVDRLLAGLVARPVWQQNAACRGADARLFFIERGGDPRPAKALCASCPVAEQCRTFALTSPEPLHGVWGGLSALDRKKGRTVPQGPAEPLPPSTSGRRTWRSRQPCGTRATYNAGCRCNDCRTANREWSRALAARKRTERAAAPPLLGIGGSPGEGAA